MKLSEDEKRLTVSAITDAIALAEEHRATVVVWRLKNLRKKYEAALRHGGSE